MFLKPLIRERILNSRLQKQPLMLIWKFSSLDMNNLFRTRSNNVGRRHNFKINTRALPGEAQLVEALSCTPKG